MISDFGCFKFNVEYNHIVGSINDPDKLAVVGLYNYCHSAPLWEIRFLFNIKNLQQSFSLLHKTDDLTMAGTAEKVQDVVDQFLLKMSKLTSFI